MYLYVFVCVYMYSHLSICPPFYLYVFEGCMFRCTFIYMCIPHQQLLLLWHLVLSGQLFCYIFVRKGWPVAGRACPRTGARADMALNLSTSNSWNLTEHFFEVSEYPGGFFFGFFVLYH